MSTDRRNPYVILGVPFGATSEEARTGLARKSRHLRQHQDAPYSTEDLTWALHQVEQIIEDTSKAFHVYRVPASPNATKVNRPGIFNPPPEPIARRTPPSTDEQQAVLRARGVQALLNDALTAEPVTFDIPKPHIPKEPAND
jgi:hypothetical protein